MNSFKPINFCDGVDHSPEAKVKELSGVAVRITSKCDSRCPFCIANADMQRVLPVNVDKMIETIKNSDIKTLQILGGEPFLFLNNCIKLVESVQDQIEHMFFTTAIPYTLVTQWDKFERVMKTTKNLYVSIQSVDWEKNNRLMNSKKDFNRIEILRKIVENYGDGVTVVLNLVKGGVDNYDELYYSLNFLREMGVKNIRINELQGAEDQYVNFEQIAGIKMESPYAHGCKTKMNIYPEVNIIVKRSCFMVEDSLGATDEDIEKLQYKLDNPEKFQWREKNVLYEDGSLEFKWVYNNQNPMIKEEK